ncbi:hypothetical protein A2764_01280 [Candidatus Kaiserbacteria bacterium RIFCSPHIGHO2_01_FULL_55_79]|nr:MAG: hypothetical protein A2764_01280 [Candidatus Kaiserbacteria bacterium RIFCSPHIGHO2_01_FULL_55_79]OGG78418.1 MAG: hypothetical protein A3F56_03250 [Candidatus Kaiserbacteria bacterium RIFCSPHIGHO2_12_FULL_55_13]
MTDGQIKDLLKKVAEAARKHRKDVSQKAAGQALGVPNIGTMMFAVFRQLADAMSNLIVHRVKVDRTRTPQQALDACGRKQYVNSEVVATMPAGKGKNVRLTYFKPDKSAYDDNGLLKPGALDEEYKKHGLKADPQAQIDDNAANPNFADKTPNACQWTDKNGNHCYATFYRWNGGPVVFVSRFGLDWDGRWSFAGVPDGSSASAV